MDDLRLLAAVAEDAVMRLAQPLELAVDVADSVDAHESPREVPRPTDRPGRGFRQTSKRSGRTWMNLPVAISASRTSERSGSSR